MLFRSEEPAHTHHSSVASGDSEQAFIANDNAMQSLIAALDLGQEVSDNRLLRTSMQPSTASRYSFAEEDVGIAREFPPTPSSSSMPHHHDA